MKKSNQIYPDNPKYPPKGEPQTQPNGLYAEIVQNHPDLICEWLSDGTLTFANEAYCQYFDKPLEDLIGKSCVDCIHPEDQEKFSVHLSKLIKQQPGYQAVIELKIIDPNGEIRRQQWINKVLLNQEINQTRILSTGRDITSLKRSEIELQRKISFERLITDLSINFINIPPDDFDRHINRVLSEIGQFAKVDRSYVFTMDDQVQTLSNTHEWCAEGISPQIQKNQDLSYDLIPWTLPKLRRFEAIHVPKVSALDEAVCPEKKIFMDQEIQSLIMVPLINSGTLIGFIGFDSVRSEKSWSEHEVTILRIVGSSIGSAIVQIQKTKELARQKSYLERLNQITTSSLNALTIEEMLEDLTSAIQNLVSANQCSFYLWSEHQKAVNLARVEDNQPVDFENIIHKRSGQSIIETILLTNKPLYIENISHTEDFSIPKDSLLNQSILGIPLSANGEKLGVVMFSFERVSQLKNDEIAFAKQATSQIAQAMLKIRLLERAQQSAREAETLHKTGTIVASALEPDTAIHYILDQLEKVVPFDSASVQILSDGYLEIKAGKGWSDIHNPVGMRFPVPGDNPNSKVIETRQPYVLNNAPDQYDTFSEDAPLRIKSWMGVPLVVHERVIGMLTLDHHQPNFYNDQRLVNLATAFADQVAISLENARLYAEEHQRVIELDALRATTADITQELALENLLTAILERATDLLNATGGELGLLDEKTGNIKILVSHNMGAENVNTTLEVGEGLMGYVAQTRNIEMIEDYQHWSGRMDTYKETHAAIAAPLMIGSRFLGVIGIMNTDRKRKFSKSEFSLMKLFAQQAAIAVENAKLYEESKRQARIDLTTEIYNRRGLFELGEREMDRSKRYNRPLAALMLDIDHFKLVNDTHGHPTGDLVLKELAQRLQLNLRKIDILARYGGEEFVILLPETSLEGAMDVAERLREIVAGEVFLRDSLSLEITISLGVAISRSKAVSFQALIKHADDAMYYSKAFGRNRVTACNHNL